MFRCSCLLCSSQGANPAGCGACGVRPGGGLDAEAQRGVGSSNSLKTEEKTVVVVGVAHEEGRTLRPVRSTDDDPPVHQLGVQTSGDQMITDDVEWTP